MKGVRKVLVAVNGSKEVLRAGLQLAGDECCWVTVVKVLPESEGDLDLTGVRDLADVLEGGVRRELASIRAIAEEERALVKTRVETGAVHERILAAAEEERCDVIVLGRRRGGWLRRLFGDNVIGNVVRRAPCPVLVVGAGACAAGRPALTASPGGLSSEREASARPGTGCVGAAETPAHPGRQQ